MIQSQRNIEMIQEMVRLLDDGHTITITLGGYSMRPFLEDGRDKALLAKVTQPQKGDVVLAKVEEGKYVLHRIIDINGNNVTLRGDGNFSNECCTTGDLKGFAVGFYRKGSRKLEKTNSLKWRIYSWWWTHLFPIRRYLLFIYCVTHNLSRTYHTQE